MRKKITVSARSMPTSDGARFSKITFLRSSIRCRCKCPSGIFGRNRARKQLFFTGFAIGVNLRPLPEALHEIGVFTSARAISRHLPIA